MRRNKKFWIQHAIKHKGALEKFFAEKLGVPKKAKIPVSELKKIVSAKAGQVVTLRYGRRKARVRVTPTLERRAILALTLRKLRKRRRR